MQHKTMIEIMAARASESLHRHPTLKIAFIGSHPVVQELVEAFRAQDEASSSAVVHSPERIFGSHKAITCRLSYFRLNGSFLDHWQAGTDPELPVAPDLAYQGAVTQRST